MSIIAFAARFSGMPVNVSQDNPLPVTAATVTAAAAASFSVARFPTANLLTNTAAAVKATAGKVFGIRVLNSNATKAFVKFFNTAAASVTPGTTVPVMVLEVPANDGTNDGQLIITPDRSNELQAFDTAISCLATIVLGDTGTQTAPAAGLLVDAIQYN